MYELYHDWDAFCCIKVRFCLAEKGIAWSSRRIDLQKIQQLDPAYLAVNPNGVVPTLVCDGNPIFESSIINEYLEERHAEPRLLPVDAAARFWVKFEDDVLHPAVKGPTYQLMLRQSFSQLPRSFIEERIASAPTPQKAAFLRNAVLEQAPPDASAIEAALASFRRAVDKMERRLEAAPWFGGAEFSLADVAIAPFIDRLEELNFGHVWDDRPALLDWIARIKARPAYQAALPTAVQRIPAPAT